MANKKGMRYVCLICGTEVEIVEGGSGTIMCCGQPMKLVDSSGDASS